MSSTNLITPIVDEDGHAELQATPGVRGVSLDRRERDGPGPTVRATVNRARAEGLHDPSRVISA